MSLDPHWFSTLFGWYVFASMFVSGITTIALVTIYLKSKGYRFRQAFNMKEDRSMIYQGRFGWVKLSSSKGFLNKTSMEQGTVWNIVKI